MKTTKVPRSKDLIDIRNEFKRVKGEPAKRYSHGVKMRELYNHPRMTAARRKNLDTPRNRENLEHGLGKPEIPAVQKLKKKRGGW